MATREPAVLDGLFDTFYGVVRAEYDVIGRFLRQGSRSVISSVLRLLLRCRGKIIVIGMGKSGLVGRKIAATLSSTGTPSIFLNAAECAHGDLGAISASDVVWFLSNSGRTHELLTLFPYVESLQIPIIAMVGARGSVFEKGSTHCIVLDSLGEADPHGIVPSCSTTLMLAVGDAVAITLMKAKGVSRDSFASWHPGGWLGKRLATRVKHLMHAQCPLMSPRMTMRQALSEMTRIRLGCLVAEVGPKTYGIFTDGDLRRALGSCDNLMDRPLLDFLHLDPATIGMNALAQEALAKMEVRKITQLIVLDQQCCFAGVVHIHDLLEFQQP